MQEIMHRVVMPSGGGLNELLAGLVESGVLEKGEDGRFRFTEAVPTAYRALLDELGVYLAPKNPRVAHAVAPHVWEPVYLTQARDGAPKLFGPDTRLRNFMALAKHGPLDIMDLRWITGNSSLLLESEGTAPFGRGGLVRVWKSGSATAAALDPAYPAARELKALLLKLESSFPLPTRSRLRPTPNLPPLDVWEGDKLELFGGPIRTSILMSIGALGWTFEALCVETALSAIIA